jgi:D-amino-acid oxidase
MGAFIPAPPRVRHRPCAALHLALTWVFLLMPTRRQVVLGLATLAGLACTPALVRRSAAQSADAGPLRGGEILPTPDFARLRRHARFFAGVRPHRTGGVRLELEPEIVTPKGTKFLIHNYGHSAAGITLSWGCAAVVRDHVAAVVKQMHGTKTHPSVAILGNGVIGLTVAAELRRQWPRLPMTVYAKSLDVTQTTSFVAAGQFEPSLIWREYQAEDRKPVLDDYLRRSAARIREIQHSGRRLLYGVALRRNYTLDIEDRAFGDYTPRDVVPGFKRGTLPFKGLDAVGREYMTWLMNPRILLPRLKAVLGHAGVRFRAREFADRDQVLGLRENIIINCTGYGAKSLFGDQALVPRRGHVVILRNPARLTYFFSGGCENDVVSYVFTRQHDIVVGGTFIRDDERDYFDAGDPKDAQRCNLILDNAETVFAGRPGACVAPDA